MTFARHEFDSPLWLKLQEHLKERIAVMREKNDSTNLSDAETAVLRGKIAFAKEILALAAAPVVVPAEENRWSA